MKYAIVIPDGAADTPQESLGGRTPLQVANIPNMDWLATHGRVGSVQTVPRGMYCGSDVAILSVLGYDPKKYYTGRAPLEAAANDLQVAQDEWVFRCNLVTIVDGIMEDHSAGHISTKEASSLINELNRMLGGPNVKFHVGVGYRHLMTFRGKSDMAVKTKPPHDIIGQPIDEYLPCGQGAELIRTLIDRSMAIFAKHEINNVRRDLGENPASAIWLWGEGKMPTLPTFAEKFHVQGASITAVDLIRGLSKFLAWPCIEVPGATGYTDTNYAGKGLAACDALDKYDLIFVHVEAPDEAGHGGDANAKVKAIEQIDKLVVGPLINRMKREGDDWRILVLPDHPTPCHLRTHTGDAVPFAIAGKGINGGKQASFDEPAATSSDLHIPRGCELMEFFLTVR